MSTKSIPYDSEIHRKLIGMIQPRINYSMRSQTLRHKVWTEAEETALAYLPESEADSKRRNDRERGEPRYTNTRPRKPAAPSAR